MKRYRDPTPALPPDRLPLKERIWCGLIIAILVIAAVWVSTVVP